MGEKMNPIIYHDSEIGAPLVEAVELLDVQEKVQLIKNSLVGLSIQAIGSKEQGDNFDSSV